MSEVDRHLRSPDVLLSLDTCRDLALEHEQATGHATTEILTPRPPVIFCDDCDYYLQISDEPAG